MAEKINLEEHIARGVEKIVSDALKATLKDPRESAFMLKFASASRKATKIRRKLAGQGEHIPSFLIASITSSCNLHCAGCYSRCNKATVDTEPVQQLDGEGYGWKDISMDGARFYAQQKDYLSNLLLHTSGYDSFVRYMTEIHIQALTESVQKAAGTERLDEATRMYIGLYCHGTIGLTCMWILGQYQASSQVLSEVYERSLPEPLYHILCEKREGPSNRSRNRED